jgi:hypothetical protein
VTTQAPPLRQSRDNFWGLSQSEGINVKSGIKIPNFVSCVTWRENVSVALMAANTFRVQRSIFRSKKAIVGEILRMMPIDDFHNLTSSIVIRTMKLR